MPKTATSVYLHSIDNPQTPVRQSVDGVLLPLLASYGIAIRLNKKWGQALNVSQGIELTKTMDVCLSENKVLGIWETLLYATQNRDDTEEVDVIEYHCIHICSLPRIPRSVYKTESSLSIYVEAPTTYLYKKISSWKQSQVI